MNRLSPLIVRNAPAALLPLALPWDGIERRRARAIAGEVRDFAIAWLGGVVFFGTFLA